MKVPWGQIFDGFGQKTVSKTGKLKSAYVPNVDQKAVLAAAGISPSPERPGTPFRITILFNPDVSEVAASYYHSERSEEADRTPEQRMGQEFISW